MPHFPLRVYAAFTAVALWGGGLLQTAVAADQPPQGWSLARFSADVTIPLGHRCMGILPTKSMVIVDPLQVHGVVLLGDDQPIVLAAFDWCEIRNASYDAWREALAAAADTAPERVLVCSLHQHDAPVIDSGAQTLLDEVGLAGELFDVPFHDACLDRVAQAVRDSLSTAQPVTHLGLGEARVDQVASSRRMVHLDGRVSFDRFSSSGGDGFQADAPAGLVDPMLKTISFWNGDEPLLAINHFAVHPMSYYGRGGVSYDFVGIARERRRRESGVPQIYVSGCSGDVVAGKYNDGSTDNRQELADRVVQAMDRAWTSTQRRPLRKLDFRSTSLDLPFHESDSFSEGSLRATLQDEKAEVSERILAAMGLSSRNRIESGNKIDVPCIDFGDAQLVLLPGEAFVGYQVMSQQMRPESFVVAIGYGECWPGYIPMEAAFEDGFDHGWRWAGPASAFAMKAALQDVLEPTSSDVEQTGQWQQISLSNKVYQRCLAVLDEALRSEDFWVSVHAAEGLIRAGRGEAVQEGLAAKLLAEPDDRRRCGLARELVRSGEKRYTTLLLEILADRESPGRVHAAEGLFKIGELGDGVALRAAMEQTENRPLRLMASAAVAAHGNRQAAELIRQSLCSESDETVRAAAWILGRIGNPGDRASLRDAARRAATPLTRAQVAHSLAALGDADGSSQLATNLASEDAAVRAGAASWAADARVTSAATGLIRLLADPDLDARTRAAHSLLELQQPPPNPREHLSYLVFEATEPNPRYTEGSILELADGSLLFAISEFNGSGSDFAKAKIVGRESRDGGRKWTAQRVLQENVGGLNVMSVTLRRLGPANRWDVPIGMFYLVKNSKSSLDVFLRISEDEGRTFGDPIKMNDVAGYHVMNNDRVTRLSTGRLLAPIAYTEDVQQSNHFVSLCLLSDDNGRTWRRGRGVVDQPQRGAMEPEVVELRDGRVMMIARTQLGYIAAAHSSDGGDTWGAPFPLPMAAPESPATLRRVPATGDLLLIWNHTFDATESHGGPRTPLTAALSSDEGASWHSVRDLETRTDRSYAYTSLLFVGPRAVMSYWDQDRAGERFSARFRSLPVEWFYGGGSSPGAGD